MVNLVRKEANGSGGGELGSNSYTILGDKHFPGIVKIGNSTDITPDAVGSGQLNFQGNAYTGFVALDATGMWIGHNSLSRDLIFSTNETNRGFINGNGSWIIGQQGVTASFTGYFSSYEMRPSSVSGGSNMGWYNGDTRTKVIFVNTGDSRFYIRDGDNTDGVYLADNGTAWVSASDERLKKDIEVFQGSLDKICFLNPKLYRYKTDEDNTPLRLGLIAQEVNEVLPEVVDSSNPEELGLSYSELIPALVGSIKELNQKLELALAEIRELKGQS